MCLSNEKDLNNPDCHGSCQDCWIKGFTAEVKLFKVMKFNIGCNPFVLKRYRFFSSTIKEDKKIYERGKWYKATEEEGFHAFRTIGGAVEYYKMLSIADNYSIVEVRIKCLESIGESCTGGKAVTGRHMKIERVISKYRILLESIKYECNEYFKDIFG